MSASAIKVKINGDKVDYLTHLMKHLTEILNGVSMKEKQVSYEELYSTAYYMVYFRRGRELYIAVRSLIQEHVKSMQLKIAKQLQEHNDKNVTAKAALRTLSQRWFELCEMMQTFSRILLYSERVYEASVGEETVAVFAWRVFRHEILDNRYIVRQLLLAGKNSRDKPGTSASFVGEAKIEENYVEKHADGSPIEQDQRVIYRRPLVPNDTLADIFECLPSPTLGLSIAPASRRLEFLANYVLNRRVRSARAIMLRDSNGEGANAIPLYEYKMNTKKPDAKMRKVVDNWGCRQYPPELIELPSAATPEWITGMSFLYLPDGFTPAIAAFLHRQAPLLQNCRLQIQFATVWNKLFRDGLLWEVLDIFGPNCFSLFPIIESGIPTPDSGDQHFAKLGFWTLLQSHVFHKCRELSLPDQLFKTRDISADTSKWLHHKSTANRPRRLFITSQKSGHPLGLSGIGAMVEHIKEEFASGAGRRRFFVELPPNALNHWEERWLENGLGERLAICQTCILRCPIGEEHKQFEDFYVHLRQKQGPLIRVDICSTGWLKSPMVTRRNGKC